ncbi:hypothetical protein BT67DRAFT_437525 [Trichocladium antarcticum]|uniref:Uncharacterized protein n=1 Tax=Trichocladium antarcticum TaxID=1450529 RepID=A0AAN6US21_9PEZI|nr:hypothetical protein BT67DRAFT_437525 [Trichocladium antarcticum]
MPGLTLAQSTLPPLAFRQHISSRLADVIGAIILHADFQPPFRHPTLVQIWDFSLRTKYLHPLGARCHRGRPARQVPRPDTQLRCGLRG